MLGRREMCLQLQETDRGIGMCLRYGRLGNIMLTRDCKAEWPAVCHRMRLQRYVTSAGAAAEIWT
jgi:hypothetical protein